MMSDSTSWWISIGSDNSMNSLII